jgi:hypothetical protein
MTDRLAPRNSASSQLARRFSRSRTGELRYFDSAFVTSGPVMPLPGWVAAGGSLAGNDSSSSLESCRSSSFLDFRASSSFLDSRFCGVFGHHHLRWISKAARAIKRDALTNDRRVEPFGMSIVPLSIRPGRSSRTFFRRKQIHSEATRRAARYSCLPSPSGPNSSALAAGNSPRLERPLHFR